jgi:glycosyltransferase involved in cell wall biosynthesis
MQELTPLPEGRDALMRISIITPSYNQGIFIDETIRSVLSQDHDDIEHIVVDGGSTDETTSVLRRYPHLRWVSERDRGQSDAINKGFRMATGEILAWLNSDDRYEENVLGDVVRYFQSHPECNILYGDISFIDRQGRRLYDLTGDKLSYDAIAGWPDLVRQPSTFWRRTLVDERGGVDEQFHVVMDFDFFVRIGRGEHFHYLPRILSQYRCYEENKSLSLGRLQVREMMRVYRKNGIPMTRKILRFLGTKYALTFTSIKRVHGWWRKLMPRKAAL